MPNLSKNTTLVGLVGVDVFHVQYLLYIKFRLYMQRSQRANQMKGRSSLLTLWSQNTTLVWFVFSQTKTIYLYKIYNFRLYSELLSTFGDISFQEYVSKGISHPVFYGDLVYKLRRVKDTPNFISSGSKIVKRLRRRQYDPLIIERTWPFYSLVHTFPKALHSD